MTEKTKNILSLNHTEAMDFFLKSEQYHGFELPEYFVFDDLLQNVKNAIGETPYEECLQEDMSPAQLPDVNLDILLNKDGRYAVRPIILANPFLYYFLVREICNEQSWARYAQNNPLTCPNLENISMIHYDDKLYAFGGKATTGEGEVAPFERFYCSIDNGLTWDPVSRSVTFPEDGSFRAFYESSHGNYSCTVDSEHFIWIIWENGALSRGRINRLGFAPKW